MQTTTLLLRFQQVSIVVRRQLHAQKNLKTITDVPALKEIPFLGHLHLFLPGGKYTLERFTEAVHDISKQLGAIFKLNLAGNRMIVTINADDAKTLLLNEGKYPFRPTFPALVHYRERRFNSVGITPGNGEEWYKFRSGVTSLLNPSVFAKYQNRHSDIAVDFVGYIKKIRNQKNFVVEDIGRHVLKFAVEAIAVTSPGHRFLCLSQEGDTEAENIVNASVEFMEGLYEALFGLPLWKLYKTAGYKKLERSHEHIFGITHQYLLELKAQNDKNPSLMAENHPFLSSLFANKKLTWEDKLMLAMEVFLGGIDALAATLTLTLHYLAKNKVVQEIAREDAKNEKEHKFLRACIKETLRLSPTAGAITRKTVNDAVFSGYKLPAGTSVMAFTSVTSRLEEYFEESQQYRPQRWLRSSSETYHKFASLPFGHGPRNCPGKRLAEQEMVLFLKHVLLEFNLDSVDDAPVGMIFRLNRVPDRKINVKLTDTNR